MPMPETSTSKAATIISSGRIPSGMCPRLNGDLLHAFRYDTGNAVLGHGDPIEHVSSFHRPLLMGDYQDLCALLELIDQPKEAMQVHVIQCGFDLVQEIERRRARPADSEQE